MYVCGRWSMCGVWHVAACGKGQFWLRGLHRMRVTCFEPLLIGPQCGCSYQEMRNAWAALWEGQLLAFINCDCSCNCNCSCHCIAATCMHQDMTKQQLVSDKSNTTVAILIMAYAKIHKNKRIKSYYFNCTII